MNDEECTCGHLVNKNHYQSHKWNNKLKEMDVRIKCRFCKCDMLLEHYNII